MYKVIVVDDEPILLMGIRACINWEENGYLFAGQAQNGKEALELIEKVRPDIIFTDIKMPCMDGIELLKIVSRDYPDCKVVVLSCLSEMEIVREALVLGASDYILKLSMQPEELIHILNKTAEKLENSRKQMLRLKDAEKILTTHKKEIEKSLFYDFLNGVYGEEVFTERAKNSGVFLPSGKLTLAVFQVYRLTEEEKPQMDELRGEAEKMLRQFLMPQIEEYSLFAKEEQIVFLCLTEKLGNNSREVQQFFKQIQRNAEKWGIGLTVGVTKSFEGLGKLPERYREAESALSSRFYLTEETVIMAGNIPEMEKGTFVVSLAEEKKIFEAVVERRMKEAESRIHGLFQEAKKKRTETMSVKKGTENFCYGIICLADRMYGSTFHELEEIDYRGFIKEARTLVQLEQEVLSFIRKIDEYIRRNASNSCRREIVLAKQYVYDHLNEDITLEQVASHVNISRSYFSMLFKQLEKESFTQFVNRTKMETAKQLLMTHQLHIYEAAEKVGIENENYFTKLFKRYIGVNPSTFLMDKKEKKHDSE